MAKTLPKIQLKNLSKSFGSKVILKEINLDVDAGKSLVIIGGSGTGKSVLLKCVLSLMERTTGNILVDGQSVVGLKPHAYNDFMRRCGVLFQGSALFDSLRVWENVAFGLIHSQKLPVAEAKALALKKLSQVGLDSKVSHLYPSELSGGMQRRVALARTVAGDPEIMFFDEPTTGLDPIMSGVINELISQSVRALGATAITITHDMNSVRHVADHVAMLHEGHIVWSGPVGDLDKTDNPYVVQFIHGKTQGPIHVETG
jgi:phospholipid/cholesterol/gamma-HCH transport system ATP-binding protein